jgi:hypothetical protein
MNDAFKVKTHEILTFLKALQRGGLLEKPKMHLNLSINLREDGFSRGVFS